MLYCYWKRKASYDIVNENILPIKERLTFLMLLLSIFSAFLIIVAIGRQELFLYIKEVHLLAFDRNYSYIAWVFLTIIIYILFEVIESKKLLKTFHRYLKHIAITFIFALSLLNGYKVFDTNQNMKELFEPTLVFVKQVNRFIHSHRSESDFSFMLVSRPDEDAYLWFLRKTGDMPGKKYYISDVLYQKHLNQTSPKYLFYYQNTEKQSQIYRTEIWHNFD